MENKKKYEEFCMTSTEEVVIFVILYVVFANYNRETALHNRVEHDFFQKN